MEIETTDGFLKIATVARRLDCHKDTVRKLIHCEVLKAVKHGGVLVVTKDEFNRYYHSIADPKGKPNGKVS